MLMNARDAYLQTKAREEAVKAERDAKISAFIHGPCAQAQKEQMESIFISYSATVKIPQELTPSEVEEELHRMGYSTRVCFGVPALLTFCWKKIKIGG